MQDPVTFSVQAQPPTKTAWAPAVISGLLTGAISVITSVSLAALIFNGSLSSHLSYGIDIALSSAALIGLIVSLAGSCGLAIAIPQDRVAPILAIMAAAIAAAPARATPDQVFADVVLVIVVTTLVTGAFLLTLGLARAGGLMRFIPYSVLGGFFAGTGWLLVLGGLRVMSGLQLDSLTAAAQLVDPASLARWLPGLAMALAIYGMSRVYSYAVVLPLTLFGAAGLFFLVALASGKTLGTLSATGWLLGPLATTSAEPFTLGVVALLGDADWTVALAQWSNIGTILVVSALSILLSVSALEMLSGRDIDVNRELRVAGAANLVAGLGGGMVGFHSLSLSSLRLKLGAQPRLPGVVAALVCGGALLYGTEAIGYLPRILLGGLLLFLGLSFLARWLLGTWDKLPRNEYLVIPLILVVIATAGFIEGVLTGVLAALVLFVLNYSRTQVIRYNLSGAGIRSSVERNLDDERLLRQYGEQLRILKLRGYLFFGTATQLSSQVKARAEQPEGPPLRFTIIDFSQVSGIDSSAGYAFHRMRQLAKQKDFVLVLTGLSRQLQERLLDSQDVDQDSNLQRFVDLDHGLEWCENRMLAALGRCGSRVSQTILRRVAGHFDDEVKVAEFLAYFAEESFPAGHQLIRQGEAADDLYFLEQGEVSVYLQSAEGEAIRIRRTGSGTIIGELGFYLGTPRSASVTADRPGKVYRLTAAALARMEQERPEFAAVLHRFMADLLAERLLHTTRTLETLMD
jgi:SulP family sulfate permease